MFLLLPDFIKALQNEGCSEKALKKCSIAKDKMSLIGQANPKKMGGYWKPITSEGWKPDVLIKCFEILIKVRNEYCCSDEINTLTYLFEKPCTKSFDPLKQIGNIGWKYNA